MNTYCALKTTKSMFIDMSVRKRSASLGQPGHGYHACCNLCGNICGLSGSRNDGPLHGQGLQTDLYRLATIYHDVWVY